jgi:hypothetical protein
VCGELETMAHWKTKSSRFGGWILKSSDSRLASRICVQKHRCAREVRVKCGLGVKDETGCFRLRYGWLDGGASAPP